MKVKPYLINMKKFLPIVLLIISLSGFAQENAVKIGLMGAGYGNYSLTYERKITSNSSVNVTGGFWDLKISSVDLFNYFNEGEGVWLQEVNAGWNIALDYRFYVGKHEAIKGFYIAPYLRYWNNSMVLADFIDNASVDKMTFDVEARFSGLGFGAQAGYHWLIGDKFSIDWYFIGLGVENISLNADYISQTASNFNYALIEGDVREVFTDTPDFIRNKVNVTKSSESLHIKIPIWAPGIRSGFTLGYAF